MSNGVISNNTPLDIDTLFDQVTSQEQIRESFDKMTAPTGRYRFVATKVEALAGSEDHPIPMLRGRQYVHVFGKMTEVLPDGTEKRRGSIGFDASWEPRKTEKGVADRPSKLWGQTVVAFDMKTSKVGEVVNALGQYPLTLYVTENFKTPEGWRRASDPEVRKMYRSKGYDARNFTESVSRA